MPTSIEAPLPFPILVSETPSIGKEEPHRNIWAITRFWVDNPDVHIHVPEPICQLFMQHWHVILEVLNERLPSVLKFWGQGDRKVLAVNVKLFNINLECYDGALSIGWLLEFWRGGIQDLNQISAVLSMEPQQLIDNLHSTLRALQENRYRVPRG